MSSLAEPQSREDLLGVFAKQPIAGECKTRLAAHTGNETAAALAAAFVRDTSARFSRVGSTRCLAYAPQTAAARSFFEGIGNGLYESWPQPEGDLGARLAAFFEVSLARFERVVVIGADSPTVPVTYVEDAFESLRERDCVLGPAADGGFYLVGLRRLHPELFRDVEWSTSRVLEQIVERIRTAGFSLSLLPVWYDVDTGDDLQLLRGHVAALRHAGQGCDLAATTEALEALNPDADVYWYGVRCLFDHGPPERMADSRVYEERIVMLRAASFEDAIAKAEREAAEYTSYLTGVEYLGLAQAYEIPEEPTHDPLQECTEVFSLMRDSPLAAEDYVNRFFATGSERNHDCDDPA